MNYQTPEPLSARMERGPVIGIINLIPSVIVVEQLCSAPFDFIWMDLEHGPSSVLDLGAATSICIGRGITPLVRVPCIADWAVKWVLEQGVRGVVFPFCNSAEEARFAVSACKYPPQGHRGYFPDVPAARWGVDAATYVERANDEIAVILQIEHRTAADRIEQIAATAGADLLFVGPMDLSGSYGKLTQVDDPEVSAAIDRTLAAGKAAGRRMGILAGTPDAIRRRLDQGFDFICVSPDISLLNQAVGKYWEQVAAAAGR
jgi:2-keto-3-deoxy-L-rhamnonate aldolase RhmA